MGLMTNAERRAFLKQLAKAREDFFNWPHDLADEAWQCIARFPTPAPGYKLVPRTPTPAMVSAGEQHMGDNFEYLIPAIYESMIAAAAGVDSPRTPASEHPLLKPFDDPEIAALAGEAFDNGKGTAGVRATHPRPCNAPMCGGDGSPDCRCWERTEGAK